MTLLPLNLVVNWPVSSFSFTHTTQVQFPLSNTCSNI